MPTLLVAGTVNEPVLKLGWISKATNTSLFAEADSEEVINTVLPIPEEAICVPAIVVEPDTKNDPEMDVLPREIIPLRAINSFGIILPRHYRRSIINMN